MEEKIYFKNSKGNKLCGILSDSGKSKTLMILCHGFSVDKNSRTYNRLQTDLNKKNIATFRFDFFGHGESEGKFEDITISEAVTNALSAISLMKQRGYKKIGLLGGSFGGSVAVIAASKVKDLFVLVLISPVSDYLERDLKLPNPEGWGF